MATLNASPFKVGHYNDLGARVFGIALDAGFSKQDYLDMWIDRDTHLPDKWYSDLVPDASDSRILKECSKSRSNVAMTFWGFACGFAMIAGPKTHPTFDEVYDQMIRRYFLNVHMKRKRAERTAELAKRNAEVAALVLQFRNLLDDLRRLIDSFIIEDVKTMHRVKVQTYRNELNLWAQAVAALWNRINPDLFSLLAQIRPLDPSQVPILEGEMQALILDFDNKYDQEIQEIDDRLNVLNTYDDARTRALLAKAQKELADCKLELEPFTTLPEIPDDLLNDLESAEQIAFTIHYFRKMFDASWKRAELAYEASEVDALQVLQDMSLIVGTIPMDIVDDANKVIQDLKDLHMERYRKWYADFQLLAPAAYATEAEKAAHLKAQIDMQMVNLNAFLDKLAGERDVIDDRVNKNIVPFVQPGMKKDDLKNMLRLLENVRPNLRIARRDMDIIHLLMTKLHAFNLPYLDAQLIAHEGTFQLITTDLNAMFQQWGKSLEEVRDQIKAVPAVAAALPSGPGTLITDVEGFDLHLFEYTPGVGFHGRIPTGSLVPVPSPTAASVTLTPFASAMFPAGTAPSGGIPGSSSPVPSGSGSPSPSSPVASTGGPSPFVPPLTLGPSQLATALGALSPTSAVQQAKARELDNYKKTADALMAKIKEISPLKNATAQAFLDQYENKYYTGTNFTSTASLVELITFFDKVVTDGLVSIYNPPTNDQKLDLLNYVGVENQRLVQAESAKKAAEKKAKREAAQKKAEEAKAVIAASVGGVASPSASVFSGTSASSGQAGTSGKKQKKKNRKPNN
jgi:hypothetical protein